MSTSYDGSRSDSAAAWSEMLGALGESGESICARDAAADGLETAEGFRFLTRLYVATAEMFLENGDRSRPAFTRLMTPTRKFFGDNPDTIYDYAPLSGRQRFRIKGTRGACLYLSFCVYGGAFAGQGQNRIVSNIADSEMEIAEDGTFEIILSAEEQPGNWLRLEPDATSIVARQYFHDRGREAPATYTIERIGSSGTPDPLSDSGVADRLRSMGTFVRFAAGASSRVAAVVASRPNEFTLNSNESVTAFFPTPDNEYVAGWYRLGRDEALLVEGTPPRARYWSATLMNRWMESLEYRYHPISINDAHARLEPDGSFRLVVAHADPKVPNWLDTAGHREGYILLRSLQSEAPVSPPRCRVVPFKDVSEQRSGFE